MAGWQDDNMISPMDVGGLVDYHHDHVRVGVGLHPLSSQLVCPNLGSSSPLVIINIIIIIIYIIIIRPHLVIIIIINLMIMIKS